MMPSPYRLLVQRQPYSYLPNGPLSVGGSDGHSGLWDVTVNEGVTDKAFGGRRWQVEVVDRQT